MTSIQMAWIIFDESVGKRQMDNAFPGGGRIFEVVDGEPVECSAVKAASCVEKGVANYCEPPDDDAAEYEDEDEPTETEEVTQPTKKKKKKKGKKKRRSVREVLSGNAANPGGEQEEKDVLK